MEKKGVLTKVLAVAGTVLVWFPILAPILLSMILFVQRNIFRFDYLMPAELGLFAFGGGILLVMAALRAHSHAKLIVWSLGIAFVMVVGGQMLAVLTGLASGAAEPAGWRWILVLGSLLAYSLAVIATGTGGVLLLRDLFKSQRISTIVR